MHPFNRLRQINDENEHGHSFQSFARVPWEKWTHVTLVLQGEVARIYVNGVRDNMIVLNDRYRVNQEPWYLGGMPGKQGVNAFIDDLKIFNQGLEEGSIQGKIKYMRIHVLQKHGRLIFLRVSTT